jgi:DNA repair exonuclease SbcCD ATPase subunit
MVLVIKTFSAEGFRGINKSLPLEFEDGVNVLFGDLGSGKSSVINAISWCLTGELAIEKLSDEFKREDGIVCKCHPKKRAEVKLKIIHGGKEISIGRTRERARSTTAGRSPLSVEIAGEPKPLQNEEAENFIEKVLGVSKYDFTRVYCLHQELIKGVVSDEPKERSRVIDKMLGTLEVRELIDALDVKRAISNKLKFLDSEIDSIRRDKIQFAVNLKKIVNEKKMELLNSGLSESQLTLQGIIGILTKIQDEITELAREYNLEIHKLEIEHELPKIRSILVSLDATVKNLDRALTDKISNIQGRKLRLESLLKDYNDAYAQLQTFGLPKLPSLDDAIKEFDLKNAQKNSLNNTMIELIKYKTLVNSCKEKIKDLDVAIKEIENKYGDEKNHVMLISKNDEVLKKIQQEFSNFSRLQKILSLSFEHLLELRPSRCPVCNQQIDYHAVTSFIKGQLQKDIVEKLNELKREEQKQQAIIWELKESLEKLKRIRSDLHSETVTLNKLLGEVSELLRQEVDVNFNFDDKINELRSNVTSLHNEISSLETLIKCLKNLNEKEQQLRAEIVSDQTGSQLIKLAEENIQAMDVEQQNIINRGRVKVDEILGKLHCAEEILGYLDRENELANVEKQLPHLTKLIERKEAAKEELEEYGASLEAIRNAALEYEKEIVENELRSLSSYVNSYYQSIVNHPVFNEITFELEKTLTYSLKAVGNVGDIRLSTGLSNTQMNAAAVALFLATNGKIGTSLPLIIMDDPIQGFNSDYKLRLAKKIAELSGQRQIIIATSDKEFLDFLIESCSKIRIYEFLSCHEEGPIVKLIR